MPAVSELLAHPGLAPLEGVYGRELVRVQIRESLDTVRSALASGGSTVSTVPSASELVASVAVALASRVPDPLRRVLNATGVFLHTNLGRSPLPRDVTATLPELLDAACDLELDLGSGRRSDRNRRVELLLCALTGAKAALVVNNNAAALLLALQALARGREVVVSRGELVEIGGSFRIPEILEAAGAVLVAVGTTNRTRIDDYRKAASDQTALLLKVHPSNYRICGFTESVGEEDLVALGREAGIPVMVDEGSGLLVPHCAPQLRGQRSLAELVALGCDLACGSGDKLAGGPQAGLLVGSAELLARLRGHPLYRALRPDRTCLVALEAVLHRRLSGAAMPLDRMWVEPTIHLRRLRAVAARIGARVIEADAFLGGGAAPEAPLPGHALAIPGGESLARRLRTGESPVMGYVREQQVILDLRTIDPLDDDVLVRAVERALHELQEGR
ncbi:MAG TPA: L-seryl-tRNA(Sec) selenium transferase [Thermoanaerobaculia bacterium]|nr:L-seryl-tRNA(Sec) selenium transferase [Thermoanaerobaculia bacterium]